MVDSPARRSLVDRRHQLVIEAEHAREALVAIQSARSGSIDDDEHDPEGAPLSAEWARLDGLVRAADQRVAEVDIAIANVDAGRHGVCVDCGRSIPPGRLAAVLTATRCVDCVDRSRGSRRHQGVRRPL